MTQKHTITTPVSTGCLDVISCGQGFSLDAKAHKLLTHANAIFASKRLLATCPQEFCKHATCHVIAANAYEAAALALCLCREGQKVVVLASGDALYHGFGATIAGLAQDNDNIHYHPGTTAFQSLFHRLGLAWSTARLFSAHKGDALPIRAFVQSPFGVMYAGSRYPAHELAKAVLRAHPKAKQRAALVAEELGSTNERVHVGSVQEIAKITFGPTSMLVLFPHDALPQKEDVEPKVAVSQLKTAPKAHAPTLTLGLENCAYAHENNLITSPEVRAVALAQLRLPTWGVLWDVGAGSGSLGLEAAGLCPDLTVIGIERNPLRAEHIRQNCDTLGLANYHVHEGDAVALCQAETMPIPDRIFVGGGGKDLISIMKICLQRLQPHGLLVASVVTLESLQALLAFCPEQRRAICRLDVALDRPIAGCYHHLKPQNTIHLLTFQPNILP